MIILDGKQVKKELLDKLKLKISNLKEQLGLVVIQVGDDEASNIYINQKKKMAESLNFNFEHIKLSNDITEMELLNIIDKYNLNNSVHGILVQLPLPKHLNVSKIQNRINYLKDVDGLNAINAGKLIHNEPCLISCTPKGIIDILKYYSIDLASQNVVIVGRSNLVGKPLASLLINHDATVTLCHSKTKNLASITSLADILIVSIGQPNFITKNMVKKGAIVIDVGINRLFEQIVGDVNFEEVKDIVSYITPVPGGVGQMTVTSLAENVYEAYLLQKTK